MASGWISKKARTAILARDNMECCYCGKQCKQGSIAGMTRSEQISYMKQHYLDFATLDHIVARVYLTTKEEIQNPKNLVVVCNACNSSKKHTALEDWSKQKGLDYTSIQQKIQQRIAIALT